MKNNPPRIVIVGGGAGGLELATRLGKTCGKKRKADIILIDANPTHLWKPLLHEVAAGTLDSNEDELTYLTHAKAHHYQFQQGKLAGLNRKEQLVLLAPVFNYKGEEIIPARNIAYDYLVIAIGSVANDFHTPGAVENCFFLDTRTQADYFQQQLISQLIRAQYVPKPWETGLLSITIIGAGATGVELAAELHHAANQAVAYGLQNIDPEQDIKITLIEAAPRILPALTDHLANATYQTLKNLNIEILTNDAVAEVKEDRVILKSGKQIPAALKIWTAGIKASEELTRLDGLETNRLNQLMVKPTLQTTYDEKIFAFGDCAACPMENGKFVPPRAQAAHQQAELLAKSLAGYLQNKPLLIYRYRDYGSLITLGKRATVGNLMGKALNLFIEGRIARWTYLSLYKGHQMVLQGIWRTVLSTLANILTHRVKPRLKLH